MLPRPQRIPPPVYQAQAPMQPIQTPAHSQRSSLATIDFMSDDEPSLRRMPGLESQGFCEEMWGERQRACILDAACGVCAWLGHIRDAWT